MRKVFWLGVGVAVGVLVVKKLSSMSNSYSPQGIASAARDKATTALDSAKGFIADVRSGAAVREEELDETLEWNTPERE